jgi:hypothetical protein
MGKKRDRDSLTKEDARQKDNNTKMDDDSSDDEASLSPRTTFSSKAGIPVYRS